jgi:cell division protein FtsN
MFRWMVVVGVLLRFGAPTINAQVPARPADPVFVRAQQLVSDGNGAAGRALIDSVIAATPPMAPLYPQALFWRASLAASAADAESDYKHIVVDYPLAPQAADALLRLAQLELARGDRDGALAHLQRIPRDYPRSKSLARASYWTARVLFEKNDIPNACAANASALAQTDSTEVELRNQIQYQGQRCPSAVATTNVPSVSTPPTNPTPVTNTAPATNAPTPATPSSRTNQGVTSRDSVVQTQRPRPPTEANDAKPSIVDPAKAPKSTVEKPATKPAPVVEKTETKPATSAAASPATSGYSVQVAAYTKKTEAGSLVSALRKRGYEARVDGSVAPFRVRIGRYATEKDAEGALKRIKAKHMEGFVVRAPAR